MKTVLVTGSAGFIGYYTARELLNAGHRVIGIDNFNSYYAPELKRHRSGMLEEHDRYVSAEIDLADCAAINRVFEEHTPDLVCHMAAQAGVRYSLIDPYSYQRSNLEGFVNLIEAGRRAGIERFVYASSSSVYGGNTKMPYAETDPVDTPVSLYAATKRSNELIAHSYTHIWGLQTIGLRFFTVYGPLGRPDMAYWSFLENILAGVPIKVFNFGKNRRDFTYIDDAVRGVIAALFRPGLEPAEIVNLGNHRPVELLAFIETLEELAGKKAIREFVPAQPGDVIATYADIGRARSKLGFEPVTSLHEGLEPFVRWYLDNPELTETVRQFRLTAGTNPVFVTEESRSDASAHGKTR